MKLSKETIAILKNYSVISNHLRIYPGNELSTVSPSTGIFAKVTVPETFPVEVNIHELHNFLAIVNFNDDQEIEFNEHSLIINVNGSTIEYRYSEAENIIAPPFGKTILVDNHYQFSLSAADISMLTRAIGITQAEHITIAASNGQVTLSVSGKSSPVSQSKNLGISALTFTALLNVENFKILPETYTVTLSPLKFLHFKPAAEGIPEYWIGLDPKSII